MMITGHEGQPDRAAEPQGGSGVRLRLAGGGGGIVYQGQTVHYMPYLYNDGSSGADRVVLETVCSSGLAVTYVYGQPKETTVTARRVQCTWRKAPPGERVGWTKFSVTLNADQPAGTTVTAAVNATAYRGDAVCDRVQQTLSWDVAASPVHPRPTEESVFPHPREMTVTALPSAGNEQQRLAHNHRWADFHPTGYYLNPRTDLTVTVTGLPADAASRCELLVGTPGLATAEDENRNRPEPTAFPLAAGVTMLRHFYGGLLYVRYTKEPGQDPPDIHVVLGEQALPIPLYRQGTTTAAEWSRMLHAASVPLAEHCGRRVILTGLLPYVRPHHEQDQERLLATYEQIITAQDAISGLDASSGQDAPSRLRPMVVTTRRGAYPNSGQYRAAMPLCEDMADMYVPERLHTYWGLWHELGHHRQHTSHWSWPAMTEDTVNIYSLAARRLFPDSSPSHGTAREWERALAYLDRGDGHFDTADHFVRLAMFEQLRVLFGDTFYHRLHQHARATPVVPSAARKRFFTTTACRITGKDLTEYFVTWGLDLDEAARAEITALHLPTAHADLTRTPVYAPSGTTQHGRSPEPPA
jgi:hypothetical protein